MLDPLGQFSNYLMIVFTLILIGLFIWTFRGIQERKKERKERETEFVRMLVTAFDNEAIKDSSDLIAFYEAHFGIAPRKIRMLSDLHLLLEKAQLDISVANRSVGNEKLIDRLDEFRQFTNAIHGLLAEEEKKVPFYGTPDLERGLLEDILELTATDRELVNAKLTRLAELIKARQDTINVLGEEKGQARKLAYWGLAGSIVFGVISIVLGLGPFLQSLNASP